MISKRERRGPAKAVRREIRLRLKSAARLLKGAGPLAARVHSARRQMKKARSWLRLLSESTPNKRRRALDALCRDAGLALAPARDSAAMERAWKSLKLRQPGAARLRARREDAERAIRSGEALDRSLRALRRARKAADELTLSGRGRKGVRRGLKRSRARLDEAFRAAERERTDEAFHDWRKRAKDLRYQLELLARPKTASAGRLAEGLKRLTDLLGEDHDLAVLGAHVAAAPDEFGGDAGAAAAADAVARRRDVLRRTALTLPVGIAIPRKGD
jgi:CHAD domain-containing protein